MVFGLLTIKGETWLRNRTIVQTFYSMKYDKILSSHTKNVKCPRMLPMQVVMLYKSVNQLTRT